MYWEHVMTTLDLFYFQVYLDLELVAYREL